MQSQDCSHVRLLKSPVYDPFTKKTYLDFTSPDASHTVIAFVYIHVAVFAMTWACVAWVYPPGTISIACADGPRP